MSDLIKKMLLAGVGALALTKEKVEVIVDDLVKRGEVAQKDKSSLLNEMLNSVEKGKQEIREFVHKEMEKIIQSLDIPTRSEFEALKKQVKTLAADKSKTKQ
jgi:poly(hydroxyalkanoate) granule-associated protein